MNLEKSIAISVTGSTQWIFVIYVCLKPFEPVLWVSFGGWGAYLFLFVFCSFHHCKSLVRTVERPDMRLERGQRTNHGGPHSFHQRVWIYKDWI